MVRSASSLFLSTFRKPERFRNRISPLRGYASVVGESLEAIDGRPDLIEDRFSVFEIAFLRQLEQVLALRFLSFAANQDRVFSPR